jgi:hypothetical protein
LSFKFNPLVADSKATIDLFNIANKATELLENAINHWVRTVVGIGEMSKAWLNLYGELFYRTVIGYQAALQRDTA